MVYETEGRGPLLVLVPGLGCDDRLWRPVGSRLADRFTVVYPQTWGQESLAAAADGVAGVLSGRAAGGACVAGLSMGGYVVFELLRSWPQLVRAAALFDTTAFPDAPERAAKRRQILRLLAEGQFDRVLDAFVASVLTPEHAEGPHGDLLLAMARRLGPSVFSEDSEAILKRGGFEDVLRSVRVPVLFAAGERDILSPPAVAARMAAMVPGARVEVIRGAGHMSALENPDQVAEVLRSFLGHEPGSSGVTAPARALAPGTRGLGG